MPTRSASAVGEAGPEGEVALGDGLGVGVPQPASAIPRSTIAIAFMATTTVLQPRRLRKALSGKEAYHDALIVRLHSDKARPGAVLAGSMGTCLATARSRQSRLTHPASG